MATTTLIFDQNLFEDVQAYLGFTLDLGHFLGIYGIQYEMTVDDESYIYLTVTDSDAVAIKLKYHAYLIAPKLWNNISAAVANLRSTLTAVQTNQLPFPAINPVKFVQAGSGE